ncbi:MAG: cobalt-precorrin-5B (C(1))-methyltransferase [Desulfofustis sp.]|nr:cobalt-precorrin-5B (C(1))-methyltransferase [Desulfofustis sp.]
MGKTLRSGFTTGACAAAAARAACTAILMQQRIKRIDVTFPDGSLVAFDTSIEQLTADHATAAVIKDAGDDPDVTNGARITADVTICANHQSSGKIEVTGGVGVGVVTKPGLAVAVGSPAINPVPMQMIRTNVGEALQACGCEPCLVSVRINVPNGVELAEKTLNARLGIIGGISILGTTGIVRPLSAEAWTATITSSLDVAQAAGIDEIVLSTGRTSERCVQRLLNPPEEALVMMGDYLHFSLKEVRKYRFHKIHMATMWAKLLKGAMGHGQTHVRHGVLDTQQVRDFFLKHGVEDTIVEMTVGTNTAREILDMLLIKKKHHVIGLVCDVAARGYERISAIETVIHLVDGHGKLICSRGSR